MPKNKDEILSDKTEDVSADLPVDEALDSNVETVTPTEEPVEQVTSEEESDAVLETSKDDETAVLTEDADTVDGPVTVQPIKFASFDDVNPAIGESNKNLDILMDIKLQLTVELGRTELPIKKVLELTRGSIIELEKIAGEPVELYANGKLIAHGEVVVIEDNFGLRITSITEPEDRLRGM